MLLCITCEVNEWEWSDSHGNILLVLFTCHPTLRQHCIQIQITDIFSSPILIWQDSPGHCSSPCPGKDRANAIIIEHYNFYTAIRKSWMLGIGSIFLLRSFSSGIGNRMWMRVVLYCRFTVRSHLWNQWPVGIRNVCGIASRLLPHSYPVFVDDILTTSSAWRTVWQGVMWCDVVCEKWSWVLP